MHKLKVIFLALVLNACNPFFESQKEFDNRCAEFWPLEYEALKDTAYGVVMKRKLLEISLKRGLSISFL